MHNTRMSQYYRDLHDRELLNVAAAALQEVCNRNLVDIFFPPQERARMGNDAAFPRRIASIAVEGGRLAIALDQDFFRQTNFAAASE